MSRIPRKPVIGVSTRSDTNQAVQEQIIARGLKFRIKVKEGLYYQCSENEGADQLHSRCGSICLDLRWMCLHWLEILTTDFLIFPEEEIRCVFDDI